MTQKKPYNLPGGTNPVATVAGALLLVLLGGSVATQILARFGEYHRVLGPAVAPLGGLLTKIGLVAIVLAGLIFVLSAVSRDLSGLLAGVILGGFGWIMLSAYLYMPHAFLRWVSLFRKISPSALAVALVCGSVFWVSGATVLARGLQGAGKPNEQHGASRLATKAEVKKAGLFGGEGEGVYLGRWTTGYFGWGSKYLVSTGDVHTLLLAPSRAGKGVGPIQHTLLDFKGSIVCTDPKGENYQLTAGYRTRVLGQKCYRIAPFSDRGNRQRFNPLVLISRDPRKLEGEAKVFAGYIVPPGQGETSSHFQDTAMKLLSALIVRSIEIYGDEANLVHVAAYFIDGVRPGLHKLKESEFPSVQLVGREVWEMAQGERGSVLSTLSRQMAVFLEPQVAETVGGHDFSPEDLVDGDVAGSLYLEATEAEIRRIGPYFRVILQGIVGALSKDLEYSATQATKAHNHKMVFVLDEAATLGRMDAFAKALSWMPGAGMRALIVFQTLQQLYQTYGREEETITGNCSVVVAMKANDRVTANHLTHMIGKSTVERVDRRVQGLASPLDPGSRSKAYASRELFDVNDIRTMHEHKEIVLAGNLPPIYCHKLFRPADKKFQARVLPEPELEKAA